MNSLPAKPDEGSLQTLRKLAATVYLRQILSFTFLGLPLPAG